VAGACAPGGSVALFQVKTGEPLSPPVEGASTRFWQSSVMFVLLTFMSSHVSSISPSVSPVVRPTLATYSPSSAKSSMPRTLNWSFPTEMLL
jgi:hypothetical protein